VVDAGCALGCDAAGAPLAAALAESRLPCGLVVAGGPLGLAEDSEDSATRDPVEGFADSAAAGEDAFGAVSASAVGSSSGPPTSQAASMASARQRGQRRTCGRAVRRTAWARHGNGTR
jgi:hypothetical protein